MGLLTEVMLLGQDSMGSYALSKDKTELLIIGLAALLERILRVIRQQAVVELVALNAFPIEATPDLQHGPIKVPNFADLASMMGAAAGSGFLTPDDAGEQWTRDLLNMPALQTPRLDAPGGDQVTEDALFDG